MCIQRIVWHTPQKNHPWKSWTNITLPTVYLQLEKNSLCYWIYFICHYSPYSITNRFISFFMRVHTQNKEINFMLISKQIQWKSGCIISNVLTKLTYLLISIAYKEIYYILEQRNTVNVKIEWSPQTHKSTTL